LKVDHDSRQTIVTAQPLEKSLYPMTRLDSVDATMAWGRSLADTLSAGDVVALVGNLGAGKTHAAKGIVAGLGSALEVSSPTFTLVHEYPGSRLTAFHFDFYRLTSAPEVINIGWDDYLDANGVVIVEWADKFPELLPASSRWFRFKILPDGARCVEEAEGPGANHSIFAPPIDGDELDD
jgi:tRNA threonylcarbamoyladenosine biosynthesis protein TsaE